LVTSKKSLHMTAKNVKVVELYHKWLRGLVNSTDEPAYLLWRLSSLSGQGLHAGFQLVDLGTITFERQFGRLSSRAEDAHNAYQKLVNWRKTSFPEEIYYALELRTWFGVEVTLSSLS
jgi:hypothetical protein